jgi:adenine/guanine phosphoribosyltransferase-like PRPP-binding protein
MVQSDYLGSVLDHERQAETISWVLRQARPFAFDTIVFRGMSGCLVAPTIGFMLNKRLLMIRKSEDHHSDHTLEGAIDIKQYLIIDDLIQSGGTINKIDAELRLIVPEAKCSAIILYVGWQGSKQAMQRIKRLHGHVPVIAREGL